MIDLDRALKDPASVFERPSQVLDGKDLKREQKIKILRQWEYDALQREVATEENMPPPLKKEWYPSFLLNLKYLKVPQGPICIRRRLHR